MINKNIENKSRIDEKDNKKSQDKKPNETNGVYLTSHIKIFDPNTNEVLLKKRADD
jgi:hypothetical protein